MDFSSIDAFEHFDVDDFSAPPPPPPPPPASLHTAVASTSNSHHHHRQHSTTGAATPSTTNNKYDSSTATNIASSFSPKPAINHRDDFHSSAMYAEDRFVYNEGDGIGGGGAEAEEEEDFGAFLGRIATLRQDAEVRKNQLAQKKQLVSTLEAKKAALEVEEAGVRGSIEADLIERRYGQLRVQNGWEEALRRAQVALTALQSSTSHPEKSTPSHQQAQLTATLPPTTSPFTTITLSTLFENYFPNILFGFDACIKSVVLPALHAHDEFTDSVIGSMERARLRRIALERHALLQTSSTTSTSPSNPVEASQLVPPSRSLLSHLVSTLLISQLLSTAPASHGTDINDTDAGFISPQLFKDLNLTHTPSSTTTTATNTAKQPAAANWCLKSDRLFIGSALISTNIQTPTTTTTTTPIPPPLPTPQPPSCPPLTWDAVLGSQYLHQPPCTSSANNNNATVYCESDGDGGKGDEEEGDQQHQNQKRIAIASFLEALLGLTSTAIK